MLDRHPYIWLVDRFFLELTCTPLREFSLIFTASANADWAVNVFHARLALPLYSWEDFVKDLAKVRVVFQYLGWAFDDGFLAGVNVAHHATRLGCVP